MKLIVLALVAALIPFSANAETIDPRDLFGQTISCLDGDRYIRFANEAGLKSRIYFNPQKDKLIGPNAKNVVVRIDVLFAEDFFEQDVSSPRHYVAPWYFVFVTKDGNYCFINAIPGLHFGFHTSDILMPIDYLLKPDSERQGWRMTIVDKDNYMIE